MGGRRRRGHDRRARRSTARASHLYVATQRWIDPRTGARRPADDRGRSSTASTSPTPTARPTRPAARSPATCSTSTRSPSRAATCAWPRRPIPCGGRAGSRARRRASVTVLRRDGATLRARRPRLRAWARAQRIYSVRFIGDVGYVVTFRQVDPLYTIDLSEPDARRRSSASSSCSATPPTCTRSPTTCCSASARTRRPRAGPRACRSRSSASATRPIPSCWPSTRWARRRRRRSSSTATPSSTGRRASSSCCRSRSTTPAPARRRRASRARSR